MARPKFITVVWKDHYEHDATWREPSAPESLKAALVESRGWLISESDECIELSAHKPLDKTDHDWGRPFVILKSAIVSRTDRKKAPEPTV